MAVSAAMQLELMLQLVVLAAAAESVMPAVAVADTTAPQGALVLSLTRAAVEDLPSTQEVT
jgi:hypothetical protein